MNLVQGAPGSAGLLRAVIDGLPGLVAFWDRDLRNVVANQAYVDYFGLAPESMVGMHIRDVLGETVFEANRPYLEAALRGEDQLFDRTLIDQRGDTRYTQASYVPHREDGEITGFFVLVTDVTERREAEAVARRNADQYRALAKSIPDGFVLLFDSDLRISVADGQALPTFGFASGDLEGRTIHEAFPASPTAAVEPGYRAALAGEAAQWQRTIDGRTFQFKAGPVRDDSGRVFAGMVIAHDVTPQRRAQETMAALRDTAMLVARNAPTLTVAAQIAQSVTRIFNADAAAVVQFDDDGTGTILSMSPTPAASAPVSYRFADNSWLAAVEVARTGRPAVRQYSEGSGGFAADLRYRGLLAGAAAPISYEGKVWGAVSLSTAVPATLTQDTLASLADFAELVEIAVGNLAAWSSLSDQAARDPLTDLPNRRSFDGHLARALADSDRRASPLSVILIDVDEFKAVNDRYGHTVGDHVLVEIATLLAAVGRRSELTARIGGEEFAWVLTDTDTHDAVRAAERLRAMVQGHRFGTVGSVTLSLGVCSTNDIGPGESLVEAADRALYQAKAAGRNRTVAFTP